MVYQNEINLQSSAFDAIYDITREVENVVKQSNITNGTVNVFNIGSTASITTIEFESGLERDFPELLNSIIPRGKNYHHNNTWGDGNGDAHLKASLIGPQITCPVVGGRLYLGTWQQIIIVDSDNRPRNRRIMVTVIGE